MARCIGLMRGFIPIPASGPMRPTELPEWAHFWPVEKSRWQGHTIYADAGPALDKAVWDAVVKPRAWRARPSMRFSTEPAAAMHVIDAMSGWRMMMHSTNHEFKVFFGYDDWTDPWRIERFPRSYDFPLAVCLAALLTERVFGEPLWRWHLDGIDLPVNNRRTDLMGPPLPPLRSVLLRASADFSHD